MVDKDKIKHAFITGISGQDGSLLAEFLLNKEYKVYGLMKETSSKNNLNDIIDHPNLQIIYGDLLNNDLICFLLKNYQFDEIYNLASQSNIRLSYDNPLLTFNTALIGTLILLENIKKYSPHSKMFQAASSAMFGNSVDKDGYQRETTIFKPISPYASSKLFAYNICNNYRLNNNLFVSNGILYNHESTKSKTLLGVLNTIIKNAVDIKNKKISQYYIPNLKINLDCGAAEDYIEAMWLILQQNSPDDYVISSGETYSLEEVCEYVFLKLELNWKEHIITNENLTETPKLKGDTFKLKQLNWEPKYNFKQLLDKIIKHYKTTNETICKSS
jgi:GDPmannose 4,6-dehydratase